MKGKLLIVLIDICICLTGCRGDQTPRNTEERLVEGSWVSSYVYHAYNNVSVPEDPSATLPAGDLATSILILSEGKFSLSFPRQQSVNPEDSNQLLREGRIGTFTIQDSILTLHADNVQSVEKFIINISSNELRIATYVPKNSGLSAATLRASLWGNSVGVTKGIFKRAGSF